MEGLEYTYFSRPDRLAAGRGFDVLSPPLSGICERGDQGVAGLHRRDVHAGRPDIGVLVGDLRQRGDRPQTCGGVFCNRGHGLTEKRELDSALADLNEAIRLDPAYACAHTNRGRVYAIKRDLDRAMADYDEALRIDPTFALAYNNRGDAWAGRGNIERALIDFNAAIKYDPALAIAYGNRGYLHYRKRDMARAIEDYSVQIKLGPDVLAYINRGNAWRESEQLDRAVADYAEVIRLAPTDARGWRNRGMIRLYKGDNKGRLADYDKAVQYDPADVYLLEQPRAGEIAARRQGGRDRRFRKALELRPDLSDGAHEPADSSGRRRSGQVLRSI